MNTLDKSMLRGQAALAEAERYLANDLKGYDIEAIRVIAKHIFLKETSLEKMAIAAYQSAMWEADHL